MIKSRTIRWAGHIALMEESRNACRIWVGKPEKRPLSRTKNRSENNIKIGLGKIEWSGMDWIHVPQDRYQ
jgi:hypothetical protein